MALKTLKPFVVVAKSQNTNSFGLHQMIVVARDGRAYKTHASMYNVKEEGETINQTLTIDDRGNVTSSHFMGCEMTTQLQDAPEEVLEVYFND